MFNKLVPVLAILFVVGFSLLSENVQASDTKTKIERVEIRDNTGLIHVITSDPIKNSPSCDTVANRMTFATDRTSAKLFLATLLTAVSSDKAVRLVGTNTCPDRFNIESIEWLSIYR